LKRLRRRVSRKVKGSKNRAKARGKLARKHLKVSRQRRDFAAKAARALVMSNDVIAYEDLKVSNVVKNRRLSKSINDAGWQAFVTWLSYLAHVYGEVVVAVPPQLHKPKLLGVRRARQESVEREDARVPALQDDAGPGPQRGA